MRKSMSHKGFLSILAEIHANHRFARGGKHIKYVTPTFDMRTGDIHRVEFHGMEDKVFSITNENSDRDLELWIADWLDGKEEQQ